MTVTEESLKTAFTNALEESGVDLQRSAAEVAHYAATRTLHLSTIANEAGFNEAVEAERDAVALFAGINTTEAADRADVRIVSLIQGALLIGASALAPPPA